jgi:hypothetical protein
MSGVIEAQKNQIVAAKLEIKSPMVQHKRGDFAKKRHSINPITKFSKLLMPSQKVMVTI